MPWQPGWTPGTGRLTMPSCPFLRLLNVFRGTDMLGDDHRPRLPSLRVLARKIQEGIVAEYTPICRQHEQRCDLSGLLTSNLEQHEPNQ